ncbi:hypothetical protein BLS_007408 [Venturia inaequalis]|uniref:Uncharacterized protein n=1 Tax=Venturia inaequalis TaxID=5025 RepID=A0A8H3V3G2_VENIN|nr:hypothetical protein BLS_007408 [Venturia inaequalis]
MKLFTVLTVALGALLSTTLAIPMEQNAIQTTNVAVDCPIRPEVGLVAATLCADVDWLGYCHAYATCEGSCFDLIDYGVLDMFGDGVSSVIFPVNQPCKFFSRRNCDWRDSDWDGSFWGQRDTDLFAEGPHDPNPRHPMLNNRILSFVCSHGASNKMKREELAAEAIEEREEGSFEVVEERADPQSTEIASKSPSPTILLVGIANDSSQPLTDGSRSPSLWAHPTDPDTVPPTIVDSAPPVASQLIERSPAPITAAITTTPAKDLTFAVCSSPDYKHCTQLSIKSGPKNCIHYKDQLFSAHSIVLGRDIDCVFTPDLTISTRSTVPPGDPVQCVSDHQGLAEENPVLLSGVMECFLFLNKDCLGPSVHIASSEHNLDVFANENGFKAGMGGAVRSIWCCDGPGMDKCLLDV